ncbi:MAG: LPP20 family lipoprotein [Pseudomonadota bacterium]
MVKVVFVGLLLTVFRAVADDVVQSTPGGSINWTEGYIYADGYGTARPDITIAAQRRLLSRRAAVVDAQRNLLEITKGVRITSMTKVVDMMVDSTVTASRVEGVVKGAVISSEHYQNDVYVVTMKMPIAGKLLQAVVQPPQTGWLIEPAPSLRLDLRSLVAGSMDTVLGLLVPRAMAAENFRFDSEDEAVAARRILAWIEAQAPADIADALATSLTAYEANAAYSGLLIDASSVGSFEIATIPNIRDEDGNVLYPNDETSFQDIIEKRGVTYDLDLHDAIRNKRVATTPFVVNALGTYKNQYSDLVISREDAARILGSPSTRLSMNSTGVLIVVGI